MIHDISPEPAGRRILPVSPAGQIGRSWLWGWAAIGQLLCDLLLAAPYLALGGVVLAGVITLPVVLVGAPILAVTLPVAFGAGYLERARLEALTGVEVRPATARPVDRPRWQALLLDRRPWKAVLHLVAIAFWGLVAGLTMLILTSLALAAATIPTYGLALPEHAIALPFGGRIAGGWWLLLVFALGVIGLLILPLLARALVMVDVALARVFLGPPRSEQVERLTRRVETLTSTREATVGSVESERRRIERDLHDGPQQRLVAIAMDLGMAREQLDGDPEQVRQLLDRAHGSAKEAMLQMRQVARGIHPPVLTDRGLDAALSALATASPAPVTVRVDLPVRPPATVEAIAYFCVSEALTNVAKHARATSAQVEVEVEGGSLVVRVRDDGVGGADPDRGTGLHGLADRVRAVDGSLEIHSPPGGPTVLTVRLPAGLPDPVTPTPEDGPR